jgi:L-threonylcarbamoyladenylate synthase
MNDYNQALKILKQGGVIVFPTDTVMGIGCAMNKFLAIERLYEIKQRSADQPTAVLVSDIAMAFSLMKNKPDKYLENILKKYWPGGLTIVVEAALSVPREIMGSEVTIGIRMPDLSKLQDLIQRLGCPLVATSANFNGGATPYEFRAIDPDFLTDVDHAIKDDSLGTLASTVIRYLGNGKFEYIRKGEIEVN